MADKSNATASRRDVTCDYCGKPYQKRFLKDHTERIHKGEKPRERHASGQKTIQFAVQSDKRPSESGETSSNAKVLSLSLRPGIKSCILDDIMSFRQCLVFETMSCLLDNVLSFRRCLVF